MTAISYTYNLATGTWTTPSGTAGTDWLPSLDFGTQPTWAITATGSLPPGFSDAQTWSLAVARDWLSSTTPMCRTSEGVEVSQTSGGISITAPLDTLTERFLRVVDGVGEGVRCWMQVVGMDSSGTPCCMVTLPLLCRPALDPHGPAGPLPPIPTTNMTEAEVEAIAEDAAEDIAEQAAQEAVEEALDDYYDKTATDDLLDGKANLVDGKVPASELPEMDYIPTAEKGVADGVATLDENSKVPSGQLPIATSSTIGAVKILNAYGIAIRADGTLQTYSANSSLIATRQNQSCPITPNNLNTAVTAALTDKNHITLTAAQQATARGVLGISSAITTIPAATSAYSLLDATATTNNHSWHYVHEPAAAPTYTLPAVTDATVVHQIDLKVKFSSSVLTYSFLDSAGNAVTPLPMTGTIADGSEVEFRCTWETLINQWVIEPKLLNPTL